MRSILWLKILLLVGFIYFSFYISSIDRPIQQSIDAHEATLTKLRKQRALDTSESRESYAQRRLVIQKQIESLKEKKHPYWYKNIPIYLSLLAGWLIRSIIADVKKIRANKRI